MFVHCFIFFYETGEAQGKKNLTILIGPKDMRDVLSSEAKWKRYEGGQEVAGRKEGKV